MNVKYKTLGSACALLDSSTVCHKVANNLVTTLIHALRMNYHNTHLASWTACSVSATDPYFRLREGVCWQSLVILVAVGYRRSAAPFHMAGPCILPPEVPGIHHSPCKVFTKYCSTVLRINMYTVTAAAYLPTAAEYITGTLTKKHAKYLFNDTFNYICKAVSSGISKWSQNVSTQGCGTIIRAFVSQV